MCLCVNGLLMSFVIMSICRRPQHRQMRNSWCDPAAWSPWATRVGCSLLRVPPTAAVWPRVPVMPATLLRQCHATWVYLATWWLCLWWRHRYDTWLTCLWLRGLSSSAICDSNVINVMDTFLHNFSDRKLLTESGIIIANPLFYVWIHLSLKIEPFDIDI